MKKRKPGRPSKRQAEEGFAPNLDVLAEICGVSHRTIQNARKRFAKTKPKDTLDHRYPILEYKRWLDQHGICGRRKDAEMIDEREVKLAHAKLRLERDRFEFERVKSQMLPLAQYQFALQELLSGFLATLNAYAGRVNPLLDGLDFHDRQIKLDEEMEIVKRTLYQADFFPRTDPNLE